jgi:hypothetical protein
VTVTGLNQVAIAKATPTAPTARAAGDLAAVGQHTGGGGEIDAYPGASTGSTDSTLEGGE